MGSKTRFYMDVQTLNSGVTGSCHLCIVKYPNGSTTRFIVDSGLFQGSDESATENLSFPFNEECIEFVLITHNHIDHVGRLPLLFKNGYRGKIYTTPPTAALLNLALFDSYRVLKDTAKRRHQPNLYSDADVSETLRLVKPVPFCKAISLDKNIKVTFFYNGHLVGAALILVEISYPGEENINWLFTGDYNTSNMFFDVPALPQRVQEMPLNIMQESTYGDMNSDMIVPCFEKNVLSALSQNSDTTIVIPVFSLGRSQEILYFLKTLQNSGKLPTQLPIFFDGKLARRYTELYLNGSLDIKESMLDFLPYNLQYVDIGSRDSILMDTHAKIILTTSGMGSYGSAPQYISTFIKQKNALIHFTGFTAEGTLGRSLQDAAVGDIVKIGGILAQKQATVKYTSEFSAHAKADELIHFLQQFAKLNLVLVNHGDPEVKETFAKRVIKEVKTKDVGIANHDIFFRVSPYHLVKTMTSKFQ
jgi:metallo-beta-lactamase family protein